MPAAEGARERRRRLAPRRRGADRRRAGCASTARSSPSSARGSILASDLVDVDGTAIQLDPSKRYVMLNKPTGVVSSMKDDRGRPDLRRFTEGLARAPLQRRATGCRDQRSARPDERRRPRARARASVVRRDEGVHRQGRGTRDAADHREAHAGHRARGRPDRRRQGAAACRRLGGPAAARWSS